jgi:hypothetical protein
MNVLDYFEQPYKKQNMEYFVHLVRIAMADDIIVNMELKFLHRIGRKLGFTDPEIDTLIKNTNKSDYTPPYEFSKRFEQVYDLVKMILVDDIIDDNELHMASNFAVKSGFEDDEIPKLLIFLINGIKQGKDEEDLFESFKKERKYWKEQN